VDENYDRSVNTLVLPSSSRWRKAKSENTARIIDINKQTATVTMNVPGVGVRPYHFNAVFPQLESQEKIYHRSARDVVISAINGLNGCILCYGQTGSGKTHTMFGPEGALHFSQDLSSLSSLESLEDISNGKSQQGIVLRSCAEILRAKKQFETRNEVTLEISLQYVEIYNEVVTDLISPDQPTAAAAPTAAASRVTIRRATGELVGATERAVSSLQDILEILQLGNMKKHFAATAMNDHSSRSHTVLLLHLTQHHHHTQSVLKSSLYLVDLAGSERVKKSQAEGQQFVEARAINSSLLVLGKVIHRLSRSDLHVPYFESQLTTLLKGTFGGNCKTRVIVTCRTDDEHHGEETLQTLRFAEKCSMISNSTKTVAASIETVLECLDSSIEEVKKQIEGLRKKKKTHLPSFGSLEIKLSELGTRRESIAAMASAAAAAAGSCK
jgi:kinesin family member 5